MDTTISPSASTSVCLVVPAGPTWTQLTAVEPRLARLAREVSTCRPPLTMPGYSELMKRYLDILDALLARSGLTATAGFARELMRKYSDAAVRGMEGDRR